MFRVMNRGQAKIMGATELSPSSKKTANLAEQHRKIAKSLEEDKPEYEETLLCSEKEEQNRRKRIWFKSVKPWCKWVAGTAFFLMSLYQSLSFLVKFMSGPVITVTELQAITAEDMPWITVCGYPGYNLVKMNKYRGLLFPENNWTDWTGIDPRLFGELHKANVTVDEFLRDVIISPVTNETELWVLNSDGAWYTAQLPPSIWNEEGRIDITLKSPIVHESNVGQWETQLLGMYRNGFEPCTTWKPNVTFSKLQMALKVNLLRDFYLDDPDVNLKTLPEDYMPTFWIYATQPYESPDTYNFASLLDGTGYRELKLARKEQAEYQLNMEKFEMLSTSGSPCSEDVDEIRDAMQCRTKCLESTFMGATCRLPGQRLNTAPKHLKIPEVCKTPEEYAKWNSLDWERAGRDAYEACQSLCLTSCSKMQYEWMDLSAGDADPYGHNKNLTDIWDDPKTRSLWYMVDAPKRQQKVTRQQPAYDSHQLLSELGGTWGLFLGLSFVDVLRFLEKLLLRFL